MLARAALADSVAAGGDADAIAPEAERAGDAARLQAIVAANFQFIYRVLRRMLPADQADDATQQTFVVAARKPGRERAYLCKTAIGVAAHLRRSVARRREAPGDPALDEREGPYPTPEEAAEESVRLRLLDEVLSGLPLDLRTVFVLFELEGLPTAEIATALELPAGTVASRLRRAREEFHERAKRLRARLAFEGGKS
jgi:RNA polymerase sigma-70 factor (ECF subfamily)